MSTDPNLNWFRRREVTVQHVFGFRQRVLRVRRRFEAPLVACPGAILLYKLFDPLLGCLKSPVAQFAHHARRSIGAFQFPVDGLDLSQRLRIRQPLAIRRASCLAESVALVLTACTLHSSTNPQSLRCASILAYLMSILREVLRCFRFPQEPDVQCPAVATTPFVPLISTWH